MTDSELIMELAKRIDKDWMYPHSRTLLATVNALVAQCILVPSWNHSAKVLMEALTGHQLNEQSRDFLTKGPVEDYAQVLIALYNNTVDYREAAAFINIYVSEEVL